MKEIKEFDETKKGVKGLSDSGVATIPSFFVQPPEILATLKPSSTSAYTDGIPIIDLSNVNSSVHRPKIVEQIREAAKEWGFFQVINHEIPIAVLDETIAAVKAFHEQPTEVKAKHYFRDEHHGVIYTSNNDLYRSKAAYWNDSLQVWTAPEPPKAEEIPEICRKEMIGWDLNATKVANTLMELLSLGLGLNEGKFKELTFADHRLEVGIIYPYCPQPDLTVGITSHTDSGVITILHQNEVNGLQVKHGEEWVGVKPLPGGLIVNIGDFLQVVSNGEYQSVQHRVLANSSKEPRISVVIFFHTNKWKGDGHYGPLPELLTPEKPAIYRDFTKKEFMDNIFSKGFDSKSLIQILTIQ